MKGEYFLNIGKRSFYKTFRIFFLLGIYYKIICPREEENWFQ